MTSEDLFDNQDKHAFMSVIKITSIDIRYRIAYVKYPLKGISTKVTGIPEWRKSSLDRVEINEYMLNMMRK